MMLKEFAQKLNGREYGWPQFTKEELAIAKENGFIIVHGASDDLMEIEGAINDEGDCFDGGTLKLDIADGKFVDSDEEESFDVVAIDALREPTAMPKTVEIELNREQFEKLKTVNGGDRARFYCKETKECFTLYND